MSMKQVLVFEFSQTETELLDELKNSFQSAKIEKVDSLGGGEITQLLIPLVSIVAPLVAATIQKYFNDNRVTIKYDNVEVSALGYDKAMKILEKVLAQKSKESNE
jgi:hypothetical protein